MSSVENVKDSLIGLRPGYENGANVTELLLDDATVIVDRRNLRSVLRALGRSYAIDITAQRQVLRDKLERKSLLPFCLGDERVFVPLKMRKSISRNDYICGYIDVRYIEDFHMTDEGECRVRLTNGVNLPILSSRTTAEHMRSLGEKLLRQTEAGQRKSDEAIMMEAFRTILGCLLRWHKVDDTARDTGYR